jgi:hypothetical protein
MRKFSLSLVAVVVLSAAALAVPRAEIFGGYQFTHLEGGPNMNGWNGALTGDMGKLFGVTADFSGVYGVYGLATHFYTYTFGPEVHAHLPVVKPFVHALFGGSRQSIGIKSINGFAMYVGGGFDAGHGPIAWRVAQFDWMDLHFYGSNFSKNVRVSTGLVIRF